MEAMTPKTFQSTLNYAFKLVKKNCYAFGLEFPTKGYPKYSTAINNTWVTSFWPGMLWHTFNITKDTELRDQAEALLPSFVERLEKRFDLTHDLGFLYLLSARAEWMLTSKSEAREIALWAAKELTKRFNPHGNYIQAWGEIGKETEAGRMIVDCMMNLNLLFWASEQTGDNFYREIAHMHAVSNQKYIVREDSSTYHTFFFNPQTGQPLEGKTHQGYADESMWARGQAWAVYGFALTAEWLDDASFLETAEKVARRFLAESPAEKVPIWDLRLPPNETQYLDSSAGSITACGLLRLAKLTGNDYYRQQAETLVNTLITECLEPDASIKQGLLKHGAQHVPKGDTPDGFLIFGDYFFLEVLLTLTGNQSPDFWGPSR